MEIVNRIKNKIYNYIYKKTWYEWIYFFSGKKYMSLYAGYKGQKKAFLLMEPEYGNLGDHAIAYASEKFIQEQFPAYRLIAVSEADTCRHLKSIKKVCEAGDIIFIQGGGNMGSLYPYIERMRRFCVSKIKNNLVICMPVSVYFKEDYKGNRELKNSLKVYNDSDNLKIFTRDKFSFDFLRKHISKDKVILSPDMVYYLSGQELKKVNKNEDYLICLRNEGETAIGAAGRERLSRILVNEYDNAFLYDTTIWRTVNMDFREVELDTLFRMFARAKCVITDRMHGMIISFVMGTPCVVLKSLDTKILGSYEWIKDSNSIKLVGFKDIQNINRYIDDTCKISEKYKFDKLHKEFDRMRKYIIDEKQ